MSTDDLWITVRITETRKHHPLVIEAVSSRMEEMLKGQLSERQLPRGELTNIATTLIADMVPAPPKTDAKQ